MILLIFVSTFFNTLTLFTVTDLIWELVFIYVLYIHSENYIFGKFDAFCKRIEKLEDMLSTIHKLSKLPDVRIEVCFIMF